MSYQCPLCHHALHPQHHSFQCENHHQFDCAKEGYVNLMPAHHKRSKHPGDNQEMMQARRRFLTTDHYDNMRQRVTALIAAQLESAVAPQILDMGCGEGYYTHHLAHTVKTAHPQAHIYGLDISKTAIRYAAKRYHTSVDFCVASSHRLPFATHQLDAILRIYAPCNAEELQRCIALNGILLTVTPAPRHLYQLKALIYQDVRLHEDPVEQMNGFSLIHTEQLHQHMTLTGDEAADLLQMTPFAWRATEGVRAQLQQQTQFQCESHFTIRIYQHQAA